VRLTLLLLFLLVASVSADVARQLAGIWVLHSMHQQGQVSRDPRWTCFLEFNSDGRFWLSSTVAREEYLTSGQTSVRQEEVKLQGTFRVTGTHLVLTLESADSPAQKEFAQRNLGAPQADGTYRPVLSLEAGLTLKSPKRELRFSRHEKTAR
jgi:hypothetical protein